MHQAQRTVHTNNTIDLGEEWRDYNVRYHIQVMCLGSALLLLAQGLAIFEILLKQVMASNIRQAVPALPAYAIVRMSVIVVVVVVVIGFG